MHKLNVSLPRRKVRQMFQVCAGTPAGTHFWAQPGQALQPGTKTSGHCLNDLKHTEKLPVLLFLLYCWFQLCELNCSMLALMDNEVTLLLLKCLFRFLYGKLFNRNWLYASNQVFFNNFLIFSHPDLIDVELIFYFCCLKAPSIFHQSLCLLQERKDKPRT